MSITRRGNGRLHGGAESASRSHSGRWCGHAPTSMDQRALCAATRVTVLCAWRRSKRDSSNKKQPQFGSTLVTVTTRQSTETVVQYTQQRPPSGSRTETRRHGQQASKQASKHRPAVLNHPTAGRRPGVMGRCCLVLLASEHVCRCTAAAAGAARASGCVSQVEEGGDVRSMGEPGQLASCRDGARGCAIFAR